jgi:hypothetical protein
MTCHVLVGRGRFRLVATGVLDSALEIVRNQQIGHSLKVFERADVGSDPVRQALGPARFAYTYLEAPITALRILPVAASITATVSPL